MKYLYSPAYNDNDDTYYAVPEELKGMVEVGPSKLANLVVSDPEVDLPESLVELSDDYDEACRILALRHSLDEWDGYFSVSTYNEKIVNAGSTREYLVVTDAEADDLWEQDLDSYLDECVLSELPESVQSYFDRESWKKDARIDGRANSLNRYDGDEDEVEIDDVSYFIYRQN